MYSRQGGCALQVIQGDTIERYTTLLDDCRWQVNYTHNCSFPRTTMNIKHSIFEINILFFSFFASLHKLNATFFKVFDIFILDTQLRFFFNVLISFSVEASTQPSQPKQHLRMDLSHKTFGGSLVGVSMLRVRNNLQFYNYHNGCLFFFFSRNVCV